MLRKIRKLTISLFALTLFFANGASAIAASRPVEDLIVEDSMTVNNIGISEHVVAVGEEIDLSINQYN